MPFGYNVDMVVQYTHIFQHHVIFAKKFHLKCDQNKQHLFYYLLTLFIMYFNTALQIKIPTYFEFKLWNTDRYVLERNKNIIYKFLLKLEKKHPIQLSVLKKT